MYLTIHVEDVYDYISRCSPVIRFIANQLNNSTYTEKDRVELQMAAKTSTKGASTLSGLLL